MESRNTNLHVPLFSSLPSPVVYLIDFLGYSLVVCIGAKIIYELTLYLYRRYTYSRYATYMERLMDAFVAFGDPRVTLEKKFHDSDNAIFLDEYIVFAYRFDYLCCDGSLFISWRGRYGEEDISLGVLNEVIEKVLVEIIEEIIGEKKCKKRKGVIRKLLSKMKVLTLNREEREESLKNEIKNIFKSLTQ